MFNKILDVSKACCSRLRLLTYALKKLFGMEKGLNENREEVEKYPMLFTAFWVFGLGIPIGVIILGGEGFVLSTWLIVILGCVAFIHIDRFLEVLVLGEMN